MRISNEDGWSAQSRNYGRLALSLIPAALGGAAILWIAAAAGWIDLTSQRRISQRSMESVGVSAPPEAPITVMGHNSECLKVESSFVVSGKLTFYVRNTCGQWLWTPTYRTRLKAPDGTVIEGHFYAFSDDRAIGPGERREQTTTFEIDNRASSIEFWVND